MVRNVKHPVKSGRRLHVYPVVLVGGKGSRLWPLARRERPKFLVEVRENEALLDGTVGRACRIGRRGDIRFVANRRWVAGLRRRYPWMTTTQILPEHDDRGTLTAIALAAGALKDDPEGVVAVLPSDAWISSDEAFRATIVRAAGIARHAGRICLIGVKPDYPATGFGYIRRSAGTPRCFRVARFIEKPELGTAKAFLRRGGYFWNAGIFVVRVDTLLSLLRTHAGEMARLLDEPPRRLLSSRATASFYRNVKARSFDRSVVERVAGELWCVEADFAWQDAGAWTRLGNLLKQEADGNRRRGRAFFHASQRSTVVNALHGHLVALCGIEDTVVVHTKDATLVCHKDSAEEVRGLVEVLGRHKGLKRFV